MQDELFDHLSFLYGDESAREVYPRLMKIINAYRNSLGGEFESPTSQLSERDAVLITYGDMVQAPYERPLQTLDRFLSDSVGDSINTVHILPFFPYSSDDGFSVINYRQVDPVLGKWEDIHQLSDT